MAYDEVSEKRVYSCTGQPLPSDITQIVEWMLSEPFSVAYQCMIIPNIVNNMINLCMLQIFLI